MGFADFYLQNHAIREAFISERPSPDTNCIIIIPAYKESGLTICLDSLFLCTSVNYTTEVIILINSPISADDSTIDINNRCYNKTQEWINSHQRVDIKWHLIYEKNLPVKHFGAGLARKLIMDEAIRRFNYLDNPGGIIISLDADTTVDSNYLEAINKHYNANPKIDGCSIYFEHPIAGKEFNEEIYTAITNYELHLRYYLQSLRSTGYPYAYHTVGSAFSVKASAYVKEGGMSKRQAGEDFYFIQKIAMLGNFSECNNTSVHPSPRTSNRVPFGTGPDIQKQIEKKDLIYKTYPFSLFNDLHYFYQHSRFLYEKNYTKFYKKQPSLILSYLKTIEFENKLEEIRANSATQEKFAKRFLRKFNMFWILKYLHFAESSGIQRIDILPEVGKLAAALGKEIHFYHNYSALQYLRKIDKTGRSF